MKQKSRRNIFAFIAITLTVFLQSNAQQTNKESNMKQEFIHSYIIFETEEYIERLENMYRDDRKNYGDLPFIAKDDYFICFDINRQAKQKNAGSNVRYWLHVIPDNNNFKTKIRLESESFYFEEQNGHGEVISE